MSYKQEYKGNDKVMIYNKRYAKKKINTIFSSVYTAKTGNYNILYFY